MYATAVAEALIFVTIWTLLGWFGSRRAKEACVESRIVFGLLYVSLRITLTTYDPAMGKALMSAILHAIPFTDILRN